MHRFNITNAETGVCHATITARSEEGALQQFPKTEDERIVSFEGRRVRPYVTGSHGIYYVAERVAPVREP